MRHAGQHADVPEVDGFCRIVHIDEADLVTLDYISQDHTLPWGTRFKAPASCVWAGMPELQLPLYTEWDELDQWIKFMWPSKVNSIVFDLGDLKPPENLSELRTALRQKHKKKKYEWLFAWGRSSETPSVMAEINGVG